MNAFKTLSTLGVAAALSSCGTLGKLNQPLTGGGDFNPLDLPGTKSRLVASTDPSMPGGANSNGLGFQNGDVVEVVMANTALFDKIPKPGETKYKQVLKIGDSLKVVGGEKDFIKVVTTKGDTGYVSSVMVLPQGTLAAQGPLGDDITAVGPNELPAVAPEPEILGVGKPDKAPPIKTPSPVPTIDDPVKVEPAPVPTPDPQPAPSGPAPEPEIPGVGS